MAAGLHGSARTTQRIRAELQVSKESTRKLAARYGLNVKTVAKWRSRTTTTDQPTGPAKPSCAHLSLDEEAMVVEFRRRTLLPLDDLLGHLREALPQLTRSALHRCLIRHGISKRPNQQQKKGQRGQFAPTEMGSCISTAASYVWSRVNSTCSWPLIVSPNSPMWRSLMRRPNKMGPHFLRKSWRSTRTPFTPSSQTTASPSQSRQGTEMADQPLCWARL